MSARSSARTGWFDRYGSPAVAVSRCIPVFRSAPPYAAGIVKMPYWRFVSMATLGSIVWITGWALVGKAVGHNWQQWKHHLDIVDYVVVALIVVGLAWSAAAGCVGVGNRTHRSAATALMPESAAARLGRALAIGALHGPTELLPISSSGHVELVPWLLGWEGVSADPEVRKAFEVALHAGTAAALVVMLRDEVIEAARTADLNSAAVVALSLLPPVLVGFALERPIERFLGKPGTIADRPDRGRAGDGMGRPLRAGARFRCGDAAGRVLARDRPGVRAVPGGLAQRRDADGRAAAAVRTSRRRAAVAACRVARHRRRHLPEVPAAVAARAAGRIRRNVRGRGRVLVRVDPGVDAADRSGRARPPAVAVRGLPGRARVGGAAAAAPASPLAARWPIRISHNGTL